MLPFIVVQLIGTCLSIFLHPSFAIHLAVLMTTTGPIPNNEQRLASTIQQAFDMIGRDSSLKYLSNVQINWTFTLQNTECSEGIALRSLVDVWASRHPSVDAVIGWLMTWCYNRLVDVIE